MYNNFIIEKTKNLIKKIIRDSSLYSERERASPPLQPMITVLDDVL